MPHKSKSKSKSSLRWDLKKDATSVLDWYQRLSDPAAKSVQTIEIRKDSRGTVPHRFIVLRTGDKLAHKLHRVPKGLDATDVIFNNAVTSRDLYAYGIDLTDTEKTSSQEVELAVNGDVTLWDVISVCNLISDDEIAQNYSFFRHNCFFFSWTVLVLVSRRHLPYRAPPAKSVLDRFSFHLDNLTKFIVDEAIAVLLEIVTETAATFRKKAQASMPEHVGLTGKAGLFCPNRLLRHLWRHAFDLRLSLGLRSKLAKAVKAELAQTVKNILSAQVPWEPLDGHLWIGEGITEDVKRSLKPGLLENIWKFILQALSHGLGNVDPSQLQNQLENPQLNATWLGQDIAELCTVWNAALQGGLLGARQAGQEVKGLSHEEAFDKAWDAARDGALKAAKNAVSKTREVIQKPQRDAKWEATWGIWDECWQGAHAIAKPRSIEGVEKVINEVLSVLTAAVVEDIQESRIKNIQSYRPSRGIMSPTHVDLQAYMRNVIKRNTATPGALNEVQSSMERIWKAAHKSS